MYVCICNALKDKDIKAAVSNGAGKISDVFEQSGCKASCGQCFNSMRDMISQHKCDVCPKQIAAE